jgi:hypothetical protein
VRQGHDGQQQAVRERGRMGGPTAVHRCYPPVLTTSQRGCQACPKRSVAGAGGPGPACRRHSSPRRRGGVSPSAGRRRNVVSPESPHQGKHTARGAEGAAGQGGGRKRRPHGTGAERGGAARRQEPVRQHAACHRVSQPASVWRTDGGGNAHDGRHDGGGGTPRTLRLLGHPPTTRQAGPPSPGRPPTTPCVGSKPGSCRQRRKAEGARAQPCTTG